VYFVKNVFFFFAPSDSLHVGEVLGQEIKSSMNFGLAIAFGVKGLWISITCKSLAFCKIYVANRKSASTGS
jgi:hypothetical protein